jgi:hypothetical protein
MVCEHKYMNICPPPPIIELAAPLGKTWRIFMFADVNWFLTGSWQQSQRLK